MILSQPLRARLSTGLDRRVERRAIWSPLSQLSVACGAAVTAGGLVVLSGWTFGLARLKNLSPGAVSMKPNAAAALALCGLALVMCDRRHGPSRARAVVGVVAAALAAAVGILTLLEYIVGADLGIDQLLFHEPVWSAATVSPGRMAVVTAVALVLSASSLALLMKDKVMAQQAVAGAVTVIAVSALLGYAYGTDLTKPWGTTEISAYTVTLLGVLAIGLLAARPAAGFIGALLSHTTGGLMARWLLLVAVIVLPALGALRLAGQHAGLYSARAGVGIMVLASLLVLVVTVSVTAIRLNAFEGERSLALERLAESDRRLRRALEHLLRVQENERRGLATDLHDDALPALSGIGLQLELARGLSDNDEVRERLGDAEAELRAARIRLRHLMLDLIPDALEREGLGTALRHRLEQMEQLNGIEYAALRPPRQATVGGGRCSPLPDRARGTAQRHSSRGRQAGARRDPASRRSGRYRSGRRWRRVSTVCAAARTPRPVDHGCSCRAGRRGYPNRLAAWSRHRRRFLGSRRHGAGARDGLIGGYSRSPMRIARATAAARSETSSLS